MSAAGVRQLAQARQAEQAGLARVAAEQAGRAWAQLDQARIAASWSQLVPAVAGVVAVAQHAAAAGAGRFVSEVLAEQDSGRGAQGQVAAESLAGVASDGRDLGSLLYQPAVSALVAIGGGASPDRAAALGAVHLDAIVRTQVADASRVATGIEVAARPGVGYVRMLNPPSCARCVVLAGRHYQWSEGFQRHPRCDCVHVPADEDAADDLTTDPEVYFESLSEGEQDRLFGRAGAQAIRDGADIGQVVNARRGLYTAGGLLLTREGTTRRGLYGGYVLGADGTLQRRVVRAGPRLTPEQIYTDANGDRDEALRLLRGHGYLRPASNRRPPTRGGRKPQAPDVGHTEAPDHGEEETGRRADVLEGVDLQQLDDDEVLDLFSRVSAQEDVDEQALARIGDELDRRDRERAQRQAEPQPEAEPEPAPVDDWLAGPSDQWYDWSDTGDVTDEQRRLDELLDQGWDYQEAWAEVHGTTVEEMVRQERLAALDRRPGESIDQAVRRAYDEWVHLQYLAAEDACRGHMLTAEGEQLGINPRELWSGNLATARRYASEDLLRWWAEHPRKNLTQFRAEVLGRDEDIRAAERTRLQSNDRDFL
ncbi:MAG: hypothetical protein JXA67_17640 [Micromonosporaceae bacterium]|nr:hypothetical protein [Micromonosporaceae bacterium]